jgi:hypothetical protein
MAEVLESRPTTKPFLDGSRSNGRPEREFQGIHVPEDPMRIFEYVPNVSDCVHKPHPMVLSRAGACRAAVALTFRSAGRAPAKNADLKVGATLACPRRQTRVSVEKPQRWRASLALHLFLRDYPPVQLRMPSLRGLPDDPVVLSVRSDPNLSFFDVSSQCSAMFADAHRQKNA